MNTLDEENMTLKAHERRMRLRQKSIVSAGNLLENESRMVGKSQIMEGLKVHGKKLGILS